MIKSKFNLKLLKLIVYFCNPKLPFMKCKLLFTLFLFSMNVVAQKQNKSVGFIENKSQIIDQKGRENKSVLYLLNTSGLNVQLKKSVSRMIFMKLKNTFYLKKRKKAFALQHLDKKTL